MKQRFFTLLSLFLFLLVFFCIIPGCNNTKEQHLSLLPADVDFTFGLLEKVNSDPGNGKGKMILAGWKKLCNDSRLNAGKLRHKKDKSEFEAAISKWILNTNKAKQLLKEAKEFLLHATTIKRLIFNIGKKENDSLGNKQSWDLSVGDKRYILIQVKNKTSRRLDLNLTGKSANGFYIWPRQEKLKPGRILFSLLKIEALTPGTKESFISLDVTTITGEKASTNIPLKGNFSPRKESPPSQEKSWRTVTIKTQYRGKYHPATIIIQPVTTTLKTNQQENNTPEVKLLPGNAEHFFPARIIKTKNKIIVFSAGTITLALKPGRFKAHANCGLAFKSDDKSIEIPHDTEILLDLKVVSGVLPPQWKAGLIFPLQTVDMNAAEALICLSAENYAAGHIGNPHRKNFLGNYPVNFYETFKDSSCLALKGTIFSHPNWGSVLALNLVTSELNSLRSPSLPGATDWPDLITQCERIHLLGGKTIGIPTENENQVDLELPLAALLGKLDAIFIDDHIIPLWYDLLNCGIKLPPAGENGKEFNRTYVHLSGNFTYERYLRNLRSGAVFVTNSTLVNLKVDNHIPGAEIKLDGPVSLHIKASGWRDGNKTSVEIIANGKSIKKGIDLDFTWTPPESSWMAARTNDSHTGPIYITIGRQRIFNIHSAEALLVRLKNLKNFITNNAFFISKDHGENVIDALKRGREQLKAQLNAPVISDPFEKKRIQMVRYQLEKRDIVDKQILEAMHKVPRHLFVPLSRRNESYSDYAIPIGFGQTISTPYIVAFMTQALKLKGDEKVLEIGTGSGYQAAVLSELAKEVFTMEIIKPLEVKAEKLLSELNYRNIHIRYGNGYNGWPEEQPFDAIIVTAAPDHVPKALIKQLAPGGRMIVPVGTYNQTLQLIQKDKKGKISKKKLLPVVFVPMTHSPDEK